MEFQANIDSFNVYLNVYISAASLFQHYSKLCVMKTNEVQCVHFHFHIRGALFDGNNQGAFVV